MGQRDMFTLSDVEKINKMYKCGDIPWVDSSESSEIIDKEDGAGSNQGSPNRPPGTGSGSGSSGGGNNYPVLNFLGNLVGAALAAGGK